MAANGFVLKVAVAEGLDLPSGGVFGGIGGGVYVSVNVDGGHVNKSATAVLRSGHVRWDFLTELRCSADARNLIFSVKRAGVMAFSTDVGACCLSVPDLDIVDNQVVSLWNASRKEVGRIRISVERVQSQQHQPAPQGLTNMAAAAPSAFASRGPASSDYGSSPPLVSASASASTGGGGLVNYAASGGVGCSDGGGLVNRSATRGGSSLTNHAAAGDEYDCAPPGTIGAAQLSRAGTAGLANLAAAQDDGKRPNALPRAQELLGELTDFAPGEADHRQRLGQVLEELRHAPDADLESSAGVAARQMCAKHIRAIFDHALRIHDEKEANGALWLAGRLASCSDDDTGNVQDELRRKLDAWKMEEAYKLASSKVQAAATGNAAQLEEVMDALDLMEFHAQHANIDPQPHLGRILEHLRSPLTARLQRLVEAGDAMDEVETTLSILGAARVDRLGLRSVQIRLESRQGIDLLRSALKPFAGQIGFPLIKEPKLRHAVMTVRSALAEDTSGSVAAALRQLLLIDLLPGLMRDNQETAIVTIHTCFNLHFGAAEIWDAARRNYDPLEASSKNDFARKLLNACKEWGKDPPPWLQTPEQVACRQRLIDAISSMDAAAIQSACQNVMDVSGGSAVCQEEMAIGIDILREQYKLPQGWDVSSMLVRSTHRKLLAKNPISDPTVLQAFDQLVRLTSRPEIRTRDRVGRVPQSFTAVKAVQIMNAPLWASYIKKRDDTAAACKRLGVRHDNAFWQSQLNGIIETTDLAHRIAQLTSAPPLLADANEAWLLHGTSDAAAEGITTDDFDMTRASPSGLFGAGVYFAESVSKSDEYVSGSVVDGQELFPLLLCRVCLGNVYYCDIRLPDRRDLEDKCLNGQWDSVLGDRKKTSGTFREFIIYDNLQAFPAYIIYYARHY